MNLFMKTLNYICICTLVLVVTSVNSVVANSKRTNELLGVVDDNVEFLALKALYESTDGANWTNNTGWPTPGNWPATATATEMGAWYGVTIQNGDIKSLILNNNQLIGVIPAELGNLSSLQYLWLHQNNLSGVIPAALGNLPKLTFLNLSSNNLAGAIPAALGNLSSLGILFLQGNNLTGQIPPLLQGLSQLTQLGLSSNELSGEIPSFLGNLSNLRTLYLDANNLTGAIPVTLGNLTALEYLWLQENELTGTIPTELGSLPKLIFLYLSNNNLSGEIPSTLGNLTSLGILFLRGNNLTGRLPVSLGGLNALTQLNLSSNALIGEVPLELANLSNVTTLNLSYNSFTSFPDFTTHPNPANITVNISNNYIAQADIDANLGIFNTYTHSAQKITNGNAPDEIEFQALKALYESTDGANWTNNTGWPSPGSWPATATAAEMGTWFGVGVLNGDVNYLSFYNNKLIGEIPTEISLLTSLTSINFSVNTLSGSIPASLGSLNNLQYLYLHYNSLIGTIPSEIGNLTNLISLYLYNNELTGNLPSEIGGLVKLKWFWAQGNQLSGTLPATLGNMINLTELRLQTNQFTGNIPSSIGNLSSLVKLYLSSNQLTGSIPPELGNLSLLSHLHLNSNQLSGSIPPGLGNLNLLLSLYLNSNQFTGTIPKELGNLENISVLYLHSNQLSGSIPTEFSNLINLTQFYVSGNLLSGEFPQWLGNSTKLRTVFMGSNQFTGSLPANLSNLTNLITFRIDNNKLEGAVTKAMVNHPSVKQIYLTGNQFTSIPNLLDHVDASNIKYWVHNNRLAFLDIEANLNQDGSYNFLDFIYTVQKDYGEPTQLNISPGEPVTFSTNMPGEFNTYQWQKKIAGSWTAIIGATASDYTVENPTSADETSYRCVVANTKVTGLTINTAPITYGAQVSSMLLSQESTVDAQGNVTTNFSWTTEPGTETYTLALYDVTTGQWQTFAGLTTTNFARNDLMTNSQYRWYVDAIQGSVTSRSSTKHFTTPVFGVTAPWLADKGFMFGRETNPLVTSYVLASVNQGNQHSVFAAPPCIEGQYYIAYQMKYDLGDLTTEIDWKSEAQISFWDGATKLWSNKLSTIMDNQTFLSTVFHTQALTCNTSYTFTIDNIWNTGIVPQNNIVIRQLLFRADTLQSTNIAPTSFNYSKLGANKFKAVWSYTQDEIDEYDLEWVYIDEEEGFTGTTATAAFAFKEGVRVTKIAPIHEFQSYYPNGTLWFRVRAIGRNVEFPGHRILGTWQYGAGTPLTITNHQANINWQTQTSFAEEGKSKTVMAYADGTGRVHQQVTALTTDQHAIVAETLYDYEGRPVVQTLPVPVVDDVLGYRSNFNVFESTDPLITANTSAIRNKFFYDNTTLENGTLATSSGAGKYYSPDNDVPGIHADYIPQSNGYAYSQVSYVNDNTGRVRKQSGVGSKFRIDDYNTTRNYYGEPAPAELIRLFGSNVGNANRYKKNLVVDPNGQVSVSYVDQAERVVATALAGASPVNLDALPSLISLPAATINVNLSPKNRIEEGASVLEHTILNVAPSTEYNFDYDFSALASQVDEIGCVDCNYTLIMAVTGPNGLTFDLSGVAGNQANPIQEPNLYKRAISATSCTTPSLLNDIQFSLIFLEVGEYTVSKKLVAHELSFEQVRTIILQEASVITEIEFIESQYVIDSTSCDNCTACSPADSVAVINDAMNLISLNDCENIKESIRQALISEGILPTETAIMAQPEYCSYELCVKNKASEIFDRDLMVVSNWSDAVTQNYTNALALDPFFDAAGTLSGASSGTSMQTKLDNINLGTIEVDTNGDGIPESSTDITGTINQVTDPLNTSFYVNENGELNATGKHMLYYNLQDQLAKGWITQVEYDSTVKINQWQMYRGFYLEAKRVTKLEITEINSCPAAASLLQQQSSTGIMDSVNAAGYENDPVSPVQLETTISSIQFACDTTLSVTDSLTIANHLETYFNNSPNNYFFLLFKTDLAANPELQAINTILSGYSCGLDSIAEDNPLECQQEITIKVSKNSDLIINKNKSQGTNSQSSSQSLVNVNQSAPIATNQKPNLRVTKPLQNNVDPYLDALLKQEEERQRIFMDSLVQAEFDVQLQSLKQPVNFSKSISTTTTQAVTAVAQPPQSEIDALIALYNSTNGDNWTNNSGWKNTDGSFNITNVDQWYGITLSEEGFVTNLQLYNNSLMGSIPLEIENLSKLVTLILNTNQLIGEIPIQIGNLSNLKYLNLDFNQLSGSIPIELGNLVNLSELHLYANQLSGSIPEELGNLSQLTDLYLSFNQLSGSLPSSLGNLTLLNVISIAYNELFGAIPTSLGNLVNLNYLLLTKNSLTGPIPDQLGNLSNLLSLELNYNQLTGEIPASLGFISSLTILYLDSNMLSGNIPSELGSLLNLEYLFTSSNQLTGSIPSSLGNLTNLIRLNLFSNKLSGIIPSSLGNLSSLSQMSLGINQFSHQDILPITPNVYQSFYYAPQDTVDTARTVFAITDQPFELKAHIDTLTTPLSTFQWYKEGTVVQSWSTDYTYNKTMVAADTGVYYYEIRNSQLPNLTLRSRDITLREQQFETRTICLKYNPNNPILQKFGFKIDWEVKKIECLARQDSIVTTNREIATEKYIEEKVAEYYNSVQTNCLNTITESISYNFTPKEYHYTLYYYDQAGNLVQTVPPKGVAPLTTAQVAQHIGNSGSPEPAHTLKTNYKYNSLNQVIWQQTPDAGQSQFWYDAKGQLRLSQNAKQATESAYSYTRYDARGRILEVGEYMDTNPIAQLKDSLNTPGFPSDTILYTFRDITTTYYDQPDSIAGTLGFAQQNLRGRVAAVKVADAPGMEPVATYYSYDIHGNVKELLQALPGFEPKRTQYRYDLISGNVNYVLYQQNQPDQFLHAYSYDADNRIVQVETSTDAFVWNVEAKYQYYAHGPLARVELGNHNSQGLDYFYTLQGWIKGVNMPVADDPGADGINGSLVGKDEFAYTLGYYQNDYTPNGSLAALPGTRDNLWAHYTEATNTQGLYNGNIGWMMTDLSGLETKQAQAMLYHYDQLNRITAANSLTNYTQGSGFAIRTGNPEAYDANYSYDASGNLLTLQRINNEQVLEDDFAYTYYAGTNQLAQVEGGTDNYMYDEIGNLVEDIEEGTTISWTPYGKIRQIAKGDTLFVNYRYDGAGNRIAKTITLPDSIITTHYVRDASGNVMGIYKDTELAEQPIYGSSRLGQYRTGTNAGTRSLGNRHYELSNHLGNVLAVITDNIYFTTDTTTTKLITTSDYYPFGLDMKGRTYTSPTTENTAPYRYGFNGKERDTNLGGGTHYDYGFRIYNPRIAKFLSVDPLTKSYPFYSPYHFAGNSPIRFIDLDGLEPAYKPTENGYALAPVQNSKNTEDRLWFAIGGASAGAFQQPWEWKLDETAKVLGEVRISEERMSFVERASYDAGESLSEIGEGSKELGGMYWRFLTFNPKNQDEQAGFKITGGIIGLGLSAPVKGAITLLEAVNLLYSLNDIANGIGDATNEKDNNYFREGAYYIGGDLGGEIYDYSEIGVGGLSAGSGLLKGRKSIIKANYGKSLKEGAGAVKSGVETLDKIQKKKDD